MGEARRRKVASGGIDPPRIPSERVSHTISTRALELLREGHVRLVEAQRERQLPTVSWESFLEHLLMAGLERLAQQVVGKETQKLPERLVVTPAEAHREMVMADAVSDQHGRRTIGAVPQFGR